jgi:hypothetical protein
MSYSFERNIQYLPFDPYDVYYLLQYAKPNPMLNIPRLSPQKITDVTEELITTSLKRALYQYSTLQAHDGHWPGDYSGILFIMPIIVSI